jgi:hypothetical protein
VTKNHLTELIKHKQPGAEQKEVVNSEPWRNYLSDEEREEIDAITAVAPFPGDHLSAAVVKMARMLDNQPVELPTGGCGCGKKKGKSNEV